MKKRSIKPKYTCHHFYYNGLYAIKKRGFAPYTVSPVKWSDDPGVCIAKCSDGKERLIPMNMILNYSVLLRHNRFEYLGPGPKPAMNLGLIYMGQPCSSL